jgi:3-deoxy-D-manno-octulosonic-acid transferase
MSFPELLYEAAIRAARPGLALAGAFSPIVARAITGRRRGLEALVRYGAEQRDAQSPLVWVHAPSVGEALMAQATMSAIRSLRPDVRIAFTFFSPSAERIADQVGADVATYLPFDTTRDVRRALSALRPSALAFVRTEIWPVLVREAARTGCAVTLINAVLSAGSRRLNASAGPLLRRAHARLDAIGIVWQEDAERFIRLGVDTRRIQVTGDARFDQVWSRVHTYRQTLPFLDRLRASAAPTIVAGSTWPNDETRLIPAFARICGERTVRLIIAPHAPTPSNLESLDQRLAEAKLASARLSTVEAGAELPAVVIVDRVGILADLYGGADVAYIGGGFGKSGLHSVIEPAALGLPVLFGPRHGNAREANALVDAGGGFVINDDESLGTRLQALLADTPVRVNAGIAARRFVEDRLGGAQRNALLVAGVLAVPNGAKR